MQITNQQLQATPQERLHSQEVAPHHPPEVLARINVVDEAADKAEKALMSVLGGEIAPLRVAEQQETTQDTLVQPDIVGPGFTAPTNGTIESYRAAVNQFARPSNEMRGGVDAYNQAA